MVCAPHKLGVVLLVIATLACLAAAPRSAPRSPAAATVVPATQPIQPVPDSSAQSKAEKTIREVFDRQYLLARSDPAARAALARTLLLKADETLDDPAARFVLLRESRDLAAHGGDAPTAVSALSRLGRGFSIDSTSMLVATLSTAQRHANNPRAHAAIAQAALAGIDRAVAADDYSSASRLVAMAETAAQRAHAVALVSQAHARKAETNAAFLEYRKSQASLEKVRAKTATAEDQLAAGRYLCFTKSDWAAGLPLLAAGPDAAVKALAAADLAADELVINGSQPDPTRRSACASGWWEHAESRTGLARRNLRLRAAHRYRQALPALSGLHQALAEKRLAELDAEAMRDLNLAPGLLAELYKGEFTEAVRLRIDPQIDFDWKDAAPDESLPKDHFSFRWTGLLRTTAAGRYEILLTANTGIRLWIAGQLVAEHEDIARRTKGVPTTIDLPAGLHPIRIEYWDRTGDAKVRLQWQPPGAAAPQTIPPTALYHDVFLE